MSFNIDPRKDLTRQVTGIAARQLARMEKEFNVRGEPAHQAVHDARKRIKRLRGLYRLIRPAVKSFARSENARLRGIAQSMSAEREATALIETADKLAARFAGDADAGVLSRLRNALVERRDRIADAGNTGFNAKLAAAGGECAAARAALGGIALPASRARARKLLVGSLKRSYRDARDGFGKAKQSGAAEDWHALRKLVKHHMMQVRLMSAVRTRTMKRRARALDQLGEFLGDDHDLAVLVALLAANPVLPEADAARVAGLAETRTRELRESAAGAMEELFSKRPAAFCHRVDTAWRAAQKRK
ncbi:MAG: CHAD domain-containing protein [Notoacmeibacter sp.]|nr:CHAD domain-containing protein [Notoacmeibacter sp.]